mmetsp:Transcript_52949/g.165699  ORF Transcript_52949/g.165699 Transcript_52949/m.165699 type:complete len:88 (-) Transcript_52949:231-494(-)
MPRTGHPKTFVHGACHCVSRKTDIDCSKDPSLVRQKTICVSLEFDIKNSPLAENMMQVGLEEFPVKVRCSLNSGGCPLSGDMKTRRR